MVAFLRLFSKPDLSSYLTASKTAMRELLAERFNSKTLKTFYSNDEFVSTKPNTVIVQSRETGKPVEIVYEFFKCAIIFWTIYFWDIHIIFLSVLVKLLNIYICQILYLRVT